MKNHSNNCLIKEELLLQEHGQHLLCTLSSLWLYSLKSARPCIIPISKMGMLRLGRASLKSTQLMQNLNSCQFFFYYKYSIQMLRSSRTAERSLLSG